MTLRLTELFFFTERAYAQLKEDGILEKASQMLVTLYYSADGALSMDIGMIDDSAFAE